MARKKKEIVELRFYEVMQGETVLALMGEKWNRVYGHDEIHLHFHNLMEIGICRNGMGEIVFEDTSCDYTTGMISVIPENLPHTTNSFGTEKNAWEYLFFDPKPIVEELFPDDTIIQNEIIEGIGGRPFLVDAKAHISLLNIIDGIMQEYANKQVYSQKIIREYVKLLVYEIIRLNDQLPNYEEENKKPTNRMQIAAAMDYINQKYALPLKAKNLADACEMSETHFRRVFEEYVHMPPMDYLNLVRIQKACEMMKKNDDSMDVIATKCGFTTTSTFNRNFKKFLDTSPYQWKINPSRYERKLLGYHITARKGW